MPNFWWNFRTFPLYTDTSEISFSWPNKDCTFNLIPFQHLIEAYFIPFMSREWMGQLYIPSFRPKNLGVLFSHVWKLRAGLWNCPLGSFNLGQCIYNYVCIYIYIFKHVHKMYLYKCIYVYVWVLECVSLIYVIFLKINCWYFLIIFPYLIWLSETRCVPEISFSIE